MEIKISTLHFIVEKKGKLHYGKDFRRKFSMCEDNCMMIKWINIRQKEKHHKKIEEIASCYQICMMGSDQKGGKKYTRINQNEENCITEREN